MILANECAQSGWQVWSHLEENVQRIFEWRHELAGRLRQVVGVDESAVHVLAEGGEKHVVDQLEIVSMSL
jgi:hypothetical protein